MKSPGGQLQSSPDKNDNLVYFMDKKVKRSSLQVDRISLSEQQLNYLETLMAATNRTADYKHSHLKKLIGGLCINCPSLSRYIVNYHADHCTIIERYCEICLRKLRYII